MNENGMNETGGILNEAAPENLAAAHTDDGFLGQRLQLLQPAKGYRAGIDAVLLAASIPARKGERVLEAGSGAGVASQRLVLSVPAPGIQRSSSGQMP